MTTSNPSIVSLKKNENKEETPFQRFLKETDSKLKKEERHTWMIHDFEHQKQND